MPCPFCRRKMVLTDYVEHQNMSTEWYFHCADCEKTFIILGKVYVDHSINNGIPGRGKDVSADKGR
jgi:hypothetical protein